jgi:predicted DNA binding CopG/RHH family protein
MSADNPEDKENMRQVPPGYGPLPRRNRKPYEQYTPADVAARLEEARKDLTDPKSPLAKLLSDPEDLEQHLQKVERRLVASIEKAFIKVGKKFDRERFAKRVSALQQKTVNKQKIPKKKKLEQSDSILVVNESTGEINRVSAEDQAQDPQKLEQSIRERMYVASSGGAFKDRFPSIAKLVNMFGTKQGDEKKEKIRQTEELRKQVEQNQNVGIALEALSREQEITVKLLRELLDAVKDRKRGRGLLDRLTGGDGDRGGPSLTTMLYGGLALGAAVGIGTELLAGSESLTNAPETDMAAAVPGAVDADAMGLTPQEEPIPAPPPPAPPAPGATATTPASTPAPAAAAAAAPPPGPAPVAAAAPPAPAAAGASPPAAPAAVVAAPYGADVDAMGLRPPAEPAPTPNTRPEISPALAAAQQRAAAELNMSNRDNRVLREAAVQVGLLPDVNAPGQVTGRLEGTPRVAVEVTVGNRTVNLYDQGMLTEEQRQNVNVARRADRLMRGEERLTAQEAAAQDDFISSLSPGAARPAAAAAASGSTTPAQSAPVETPATPITPATPVAPETPTAPATPVAPETPTAPATPVAPTADATPKVPIISAEPTESAGSEAPPAPSSIDRELVIRTSASGMLKDGEKEEVQLAKTPQAAVSEVVAKQEMVSKELENRPDMFSNRNLVIRARSVKFKGDEIEFEQPDTAAQKVGGQAPGGTIAGGGGSPLAQMFSGGGAAMEGGGGQTTPQSEPAATEDLKFAPGVDKRIQKDIAEKVKETESASGKSLTITSGFRDPARNAAAGGAKNSAHTSGKAVDIQFRGNVEDTVNLIQKASASGIGGIGVYRPGFVHLDTGPKRVWGPDYTARSIPDWAKEALQAHMTGQARQSQATGDAAPVAGEGGGAPSAPAATPVSSGGEAGSSAPPAPAATPEASAPTMGVEVAQASVQNEVAARTPEPPSVTEVPAQGGSGSPSMQNPVYSHSVNDPGPVEPDDAAERYAKLFNMAA